MEFVFKTEPREIEAFKETALAFFKGQADIDKGHLQIQENENLRRSQNENLRAAGGILDGINKALEPFLPMFKAALAKKMGFIPDAKKAEEMFEQMFRKQMIKDLPSIIDAFFKATDTGNTTEDTDDTDTEDEDTAGDDTETNGEGDDTDTDTDDEDSAQ